MRHSGWVCTSDQSDIKYKSYRIIPIQQMFFIKNMIQNNETKKEGTHNMSISQALQE